MKPCAAVVSLLSTRAIQAWPPGCGKLSTTAVFTESSTPTPPPTTNVPGGQAAEAPMIVGVGAVRVAVGVAGPTDAGWLT